MNEVLLLITGVLSTFFVYIAWRIGEERLYTTIAVFLILIATVGGKLVEFFGFETNTGNIFYAAVFLATYFLIERFGKEKALRSIWIAAIIIVFFTLLVQISILYEGTGKTSALNDALRTVFTDSIRITLASLIAFVASQAFNIHLYSYLKQRFAGRNLWLRANASNAAAQILDSLIFFVIAFGGMVAPDNMSEIIATGILIKIVYMMLASLLLQHNRIEQIDGVGHSTITLR
jgi:queuosine precursor transporter